MRSIRRGAVVVEIACVAQTQDILGEVPRWHPIERMLYWIDAFKPAIHRLDPVSAALESWTPPEKLGSFAPRVGRGLLIAGRGGLAHYDPVSGELDRIIDPESGGAVNILNDGRCDRRGRFWVGSMSKTMERASGLLYRLERGHLDAVDRNIWVANGVCWSPDDTKMYFADSHVRTIFVYDFDLARGGIGPRRVLATMDDRPGGAIAGQPTHGLHLRRLRSCDALRDDGSVPPGARQARRRSPCRRAAGAGCRGKGVAGAALFRLKSHGSTMRKPCKVSSSSISSNTTSTRWPIRIF